MTSSRSFFLIADGRARAFVDRALEEEQHLWPEPLVQLSPAKAPGPSVGKLAREGLVTPETARIVSRPDGTLFRLYRHQEVAIRKALAGESIVKGARISMAPTSACRHWAARCGSSSSSCPTRAARLSSGQGGTFREDRVLGKQIEISLDDGVTVKGRIDLVRRVDTGETTIVDLKSTDRAQSEDVIEAQLHVYALGYQDLTGRRPDYVEVYELDERRRKPRCVDDDFIADVRIRTRAAADALRTGRLPAVPKAKKCTACDYCGMCIAGRAIGGKA